MITSSGSGAKCDVCGSYILPMQTKLEIKAERLLSIDRRRKAHNAALSMLHASPLHSSVIFYAGSEQAAHETRGLKMWRKLRRLETEAHDAATAQCNGEAYNGQPFRDDCGVDGEESDDSPWCKFTDSIRADVAKVFGGTLPVGFRYNQDPRGYALKISPPHVPAGMDQDWGQNGLLAAEIND